MRSMRGDCDSVGSQRGSVNTPLGVMGPVRNCEAQ